ncbi:hypothetical protein ASD99_12780 [Mesorhizobium sp. Root695]|nr:hypothetical protein ASD12_18820 [Mesorhizobium sp. Root102]KRB14103.1 hypothetical protein ASD99_12780 [Mesorhizobium sp. Root695]
MGETWALFLMMLMWPRRWGLKGRIVNLPAHRAAENGSTIDTPKPCATRAHAVSANGVSKQ